jgi:hypothetical protein
VSWDSSFEGREEYGYTIQELVFSFRDKEELGVLRSILSHRVNTLLLGYTDDDKQKKAFILAKEIAYTT